MVKLDGIAFRSVQLFILKDIRTGLVWATKIATDPFHDIKLYHRAPLELWRGQRMDHVLDEVLDDVLGDEIAEPVAVEASKSGV